MEDAIRAMRGLIYGNWRTAVVYAFAELALADRLHPTPRSPQELARATGTHTGALTRLLRCAASLGLVRRDATSRRYSLTSFGGLLRSDHPRSQRDAARLNGADFRYQPWGHLVEVLHSGSGEGYSPTWGVGTLAYLARRPDLADVFHGAMTNLSVDEDRVLAEAYDFAPFRHVVDLGGGRGGYLEAVLAAHPHLVGTLFDIPAVVESLEPPAARWQGRLRHQAGDFLARVPTGGDVYTMKNVLHNWPTDRALLLLGNVRKALLAAGQGEERRRLLVLEHVLNEEAGEDAGPAPWIDLNLFLLLGGTGRTLAQYEELAERAGLSLVRAVPTSTGRQVLELEARPEV